MSQIEHSFRGLLNKKPEIEKCYAEGLINRRALARYVVKKGIAKSNQLEAVIAMLRRFPFKTAEKEPMNILKKISVNLKDRITILDFEKDKELLQRLQLVLKHINYDTGDTFKLVVGSTTITLYIDEKKYDEIRDIVSMFKLKQRFTHISEFSIYFPEEAIAAKGVFSTITRELVLNDIIITEMLTASSELLMYVKEEYVLKTYGLLKQLQRKELVSSL